jgi:N-acetylglucosamine kinase-like BadF-type ATPase
MTDNDYYLGVDAGGTKTTAVLCSRRGEKLATSQMGPGNIAVLDRGTIAQLIRSLMDDLLAGESVQQIKRACLAFAGAGRPEEKKTASELIRTVGIENFDIMTDAEIRYYSIFGDKSGILVSAGTGSICLVRTDDQKFVQIGGWGYLLGDEGSGFDIGRQAIKSVLNDLSKNESPSSFSQKILSFYGLEKSENLISIIYSSINPPRLIASCAKFVCDEADNGDPDAHRIVEQTTASLVDYAIEATKFIAKTGQNEYKVALAGGIFRDDSIITRKFHDKIQKMNLKITYMKQEMEPAAAGVLYALRQDNQEVVREILDKLSGISF